MCIAVASFAELDQCVVWTLKRMFKNTPLNEREHGIMSMSTLRMFPARLVVSSSTLSTSLN